MSPNQLNRPVVFMVDDDDEDRLIVQIAWQRANVSYTIAFFADGQALIDHLQQLVRENASTEVLPDLILMDLNMPRKNGLEILTEIKGDPSLRQIPVFMLTNSHHPRDEQQCYAMGATQFLSKPNTIEDYIASMRKLDDFFGD